MNTIIKEIENKVLEGRKIEHFEAAELAGTDELEQLLLAADRIRKKFNGDKVDLCSIINAKSGKCSENCKYCAQSGHYDTGVEEYPLINAEAALKMAKENEREGVHRFSLVTSGGELSDKEFGKVLEIYKILSKETKLKLCASLGNLSYERAAKLKEIGISTYHHNVETSRNFFKKICDTHTYDQRIYTIKNVLKAGMGICSGGIIGMGETIEDRIDMAFELRDMGVKSIPVNVLNPIKGTPLENAQRLAPEEILRTIAVFRFIIPSGYIRYAGGRNSMGDLQYRGFSGGVNAALVGNFLTTPGNGIKDDINAIKSQGLEV